MRYQYLLALLGIVLIVLGFVEGPWFYVAVWLGCDFLIVAVAHVLKAHRVFGKRPDGTLPLWSRLLFFPLLIYQTIIWHVTRLLERGPAQSVVNEHLVVGRRLLPFELRGNFDNYIDLTAEFSEPQKIRTSPSYRSFPILDGTAPAPEELRAAVATLRPGLTYVHCAQGHGRTALFALAVLLSSDAAHSVDDGMRMLTAVRPGIRLSQSQRKCIDMCMDQISKSDDQQDIEAEDK